MIKAIILAAGKGYRLKKFFNKPKCLLRLDKTKKTLLERSYNNLKDHGVRKIHIITGYRQKEIIKVLKKKVFYNYFKNYYKTNNLQTLLHVKRLIKDSFICLFADIIYEKKILKKLLIAKGKICLTIDTSKVLSGTMRVKVKNNKIVDIGSHIPVNKGSGNFIGISKFNKAGSKLLKKYLLKEKNNYKDYYTYAIRKMIDDGIKINYIDIKNYIWKEIDTNKDLIEAKKIIKKLD